LAESALSPRITPSLFCECREAHADPSTSKDVVRVRFGKKEQAVRRTSSHMDKCDRQLDASWRGNACELARLFSNEHKSLLTQKQEEGNGCHYRPTKILIHHFISAAG
jgi:hypothetical protein